MTNGGIVSIAILLPNLLWVLFPPRTKQTGETNPAASANPALQILERIGQIVSFLLPFFYSFHIQRGYETFFLVLLLLALAVYYFCWLRYFLKDRQPIWLYRNLGTLPLPLNICPVLYFFAASILFHSFLLAVAAIIFGIGHISMGLIERAQTEQLYRTNNSASGSG